MRSIKDNSLLAAATIMAMGAGGAFALTPTDWPWDDDPGIYAKPRKAGHQPRSKSTHKQNARMAQKRKK